MGAEVLRQLERNGWRSPQLSGDLGPPSTNKSRGR